MYIVLVLHLIPQVASFYWRRYPNPRSQHVFSEDVLERRLTEDGRLYTKRLLTKNNKLPSWGRHFFSTKCVEFNNSTRS